MITEFINTYGELHKGKHHVEHDINGRKRQVLAANLIGI